MMLLPGRSTAPEDALEQFAGRKPADAMVAQVRAGRRAGGDGRVGEGSEVEHAADAGGLQHTIVC